jgi:hypothetical protein
MTSLDDYKQVDGQVVVNRTSINLPESQATLIYDSTVILREDFESAKHWYSSEVNSKKDNPSLWLEFLRKVAAYV